MSEINGKKILLKNFSLKEKIILFAALAIAGILLVCLSSGGENNTHDGCALYEEKIEKNLMEILSKIEGTSGLTVMVTAKKNSGENDSYEVVGVAVALQGACEPMIEEKIVKTVKTVLNITPNRITVVAGKTIK